MSPPDSTHMRQHTCAATVAGVFADGCTHDESVKEVDLAQRTVL
jgi:hypothetical protein